MRLYYHDDLAKIYHGDAFEYLSKVKDHTIDLIVTDPPYFLSNGGFSNSGGKMVSVNKGKWDEAKGVNVEFFYDNLIREFKRILKKDGSFWIFGNMHNIYLLGYLIQKHDLKILNNITWQKSNPAPNLSCRMFTHSTETILWGKNRSGKQTFNYALMKAENDNRQMKDVWTTSNTSKGEKRFGKHPTQKPLAIIERIIKASSVPGMTVLDPFIGSGTTAVACKKYDCKVIGVDSELEYLRIAKKRIIDYQNEKVGKIQ